MSATAPLLEAAVAETRTCVKCGRSISRKEAHAVCKRCRPSNRRYETSERRRFRKAIRDHARYMHKIWGHPYAPNFDNFESRMANWVYFRTYRSAMTKTLLRVNTGAPVQLSPQEIEILKNDGIFGEFFTSGKGRAE